MSAVHERAAGAAFIRELVTAASAPYRAAGRTAHYFARGKLQNDPVFAASLAHGLLAHRGHILDLGCGQGLLAAWLTAARRLAAHGRWPQEWPPPPQPTGYRGIDSMPRYVRRARLALGPDADVAQGDVRTAELGRADVIVLLDVLQYIEYAEQRRLLERVRGALPADGLLLLRVGDAAGGFGFTLAKWVDQAVMLASGRGIEKLQYRATVAWLDLLTATGFDGARIPMSAGTPFANDLIIAKPR